jgi:Raf kinase inhibitor-like YbhB/YbcL family protein
MRWWAAVAVAATLLTGCGNDSRALRPAQPNQTQSLVDPTTSTTAPPSTLSATSPAALDTGATATDPFTLSGPWAEAAAIDARYTCNGANVSPALSWTGGPEGAVAFALVVTDPDADDFVHWVLTGLSASTTSIPEGFAPGVGNATNNGFGTAGYRGPCPPSGQHNYQFTLYALDKAVTATADPVATIADIQAHQIDTATFTGTFGS